MHLVARFMLTTAPMNDFTTMLSRILLTSTLALGACSNDADPTPPPPSQRLSCEASIKQVQFDYVVNGSTLHVTAADGQMGDMTLVASGNGALPVFGTWHVSNTTNSVGTVSLDFLIEPAKVSAIAQCDFGTVAATARAVSAATITDTSIAILQSNTDTQYVTR
jgi:hypothetical protein